MGASKRSKADNARVSVPGGNLNTEKAQRLATSGEYIQSVKKSADFWGGVLRLYWRAKKAPTAGTLLKIAVGATSVFQSEAW